MKALFTHGFATSRPEGRLHVILRHAFGENNVKRQLRVGKWTVDFYVDSIDTYVELDGEYWHGLDRSLETITAGSSRIDRKILATHHSDRMQDEWFGSNGLRLVRITDKELRRMTVPEIVERVRSTNTQAQATQTSTSTAVS